MNRQDRRRAEKGKSRHLGAKSAITASLIVALAAPGIAHAVPSGPGTTGGPSAPGTTTGPSAPSAPAPAIPQTAPSSQGPGAIPDPPSTSGWRANPWSNGTSNADPVYYVPDYVGIADPLPGLPPPPPMILPEPGKMRAGSWQIDKPTWVTVAEMNSFNRWFAYAESRIAQYWISQGIAESEADRRAASAMAGGIIGGAAGGALGFAAGVLPGALVGVPIGGVIGAAVMCNGVCLVAPPLTAPLLTTGYLIGGGVGALVGGALGGLAVGIPAAMGGAALGAALGEGDPNVDPNQVWSVRDGEGNIVPKETVKEFDWNPNQIGPAGPGDSHINISFKDDDTVLVKIGNERWMGATPENREEFFYPDLNNRIPGLGDLARAEIENKDSGLRHGLDVVLTHLDNVDPNAQFNANGALPEGTAPTPVPYGSSPTPIPWEEPNRDPAAVHGQNNEQWTVPPIPVAPVAAPAPVVEVAAPAPQPVNPVDAAIKSAEQGINDFLSNVLPQAV